MNPIILNIIRLIACVLTIFLILGHKYLPTKTLDIHPGETTIYSLYSDGDDGGLSEAAWINQKEGHWKCILRKSSNYPVCGLSLNFSQIPYKIIDADSYDTLYMQLEYKGESEKIRVFIRNHNDAYSEKNVTESTKFHFVNLRTENLSKNIEIKMTEFSVADWWKEKYDVPRTLSSPEFSGLHSIGIDQAAPEDGCWCWLSKHYKD